MQVTPDDRPALLRRALNNTQPKPIPWSELPAELQRNAALELLGPDWTVTAQKAVEFLAAAPPPLLVQFLAAHNATPEDRWVLHTQYRFASEAAAQRALTQIQRAVCTMDLLVPAPIAADWPPLPTGGTCYERRPPPGSATGVAPRHLGFGAVWQQANCLHYVLGVGGIDQGRADILPIVEALLARN